MLEVVAGPVLLASGLLIVFAAVHGLPSGASLKARAQLRRSHGRRIPAGDALVVEMLSEMLNLREQIAQLQSEVGTLRSRARRTKAAS